jgi:hypothetical protein
MQNQLILGKDLRKRLVNHAILSARIVQQINGLWYIELVLSWREPNPFLLGEYDLRKLRTFKQLNSAIRWVFDKTELTALSVLRNSEAELGRPTI